VTHERPDVVAVGLTGGIGAGKSTALRFFAEAGALTLSADDVVHQLYSREDVARALAEYFGPDVVEAGGRVDRLRLAAAVRGRPDRLAWLEKLTHPLVGETMARFILAAPAGAVVVCEVPLLFEVGMQHCFDLVVTVEAGAEQRRQRSIHGFDDDLFGEFEALQASTERRVSGSDLAFFNDGDVALLRAFVRRTYERARLLAASATASPDGEGRPQAPSDAVSGEGA
jgi:dephospho-CoA kinase